MDKSLLMKKKHAFDGASDAYKKEVFAYADGYMRYLDEAKTEREAVIAAIALAEAEGEG